MEGEGVSKVIPSVPTGPQPLLPIPSALPGNTAFLGAVEAEWGRGGEWGHLPWLLCCREKGAGMGSIICLMKGARCSLSCNISGSLCPQPHSESLGSSSDKTLPSITEAEAESDRVPRPRRPLLLPNLSPARPRGSLLSLLGEELPPFSALVSSPSLSPSSSPALAGRGLSPSSHGPPRGFAARKPPQLLIPPLGTFGTSDLSPR